MDAACDVVDLLRAVPVLEGADDGLLKELADIASIVVVDEGTLLFAEGDVHTELYFVSTGAVTLDMVTANCGKQQILTLGEGDLLAWSAFLGDNRMTASALASKPSRLIALPGDRLRRLCDSNHDIGYIVTLGIAKLISRRLLATRLQLLDVFHT